jgi:transcriptional regulator with XRE-family HTH domain
MTTEQYEVFRTFPIGDKLHNRLRLALVLNGMSMRELARVSKVNRFTILNAVHGVETMRMSSAQKLANALDVTIEDLFPSPPLWPEE